MEEILERHYCQHCHREESNVFLSVDIEVWEVDLDGNDEDDECLIYVESSFCSKKCLIEYLALVVIPCLKR